MLFNVKRVCGGTFISKLFLCQEGKFPAALQTADAERMNDLRVGGCSLLGERDLRALAVNHPAGRRRRERRAQAIRGTMGMPRRVAIRRAFPAPWHASGRWSLQPPGNAPSASARRLPARGFPARRARADRA